MFGYSKGAFTGAATGKAGLLEAGHCGTLFLDEIGELPLAMQVRLLRFLEDGEVRRLGETKCRHVDVRVIAATNRSLSAEVAAGRIRSDLYFRLNVARCQIAPLRDRLEDIEALIDFWLPRLAQRLAPTVRGISAGALSLLQNYSWPGNVRELKGTLEHALSLATGGLITDREVLPTLGSAPPEWPGPATNPSNTDERTRLLTALETHRWRLSRTAASLGISRSTLWRQLKKYGIREG